MRLWIAVGCALLVGCAGPHSSGGLWAQQNVEQELATFRTSDVERRAAARVYELGLADAALAGERARVATELAACPGSERQPLRLSAGDQVRDGVRIRVAGDTERMQAVAQVALADWWLRRARATGEAQACAAARSALGAAEAAAADATAGARTGGSAISADVRVTNPDVSATNHDVSATMRDTSANTAEASGSPLARGARTAEARAPSGGVTLAAAEAALAAIGRATVARDSAAPPAAAQAPGDQAAFAPGLQAPGDQAAPAPGLQAPGDHTAATPSLRVAGDQAARPTPGPPTSGADLDGDADPLAALSAYASGWADRVSANTPLPQYLAAVYGGTLTTNAARTQPAGPAEDLVDLIAATHPNWEPDALYAALRAS